MIAVSSRATRRPEIDVSGMAARHRRLALPPQQDEQPAVAKTSPLVGEVTQPATEGRVWSTAGAIADHLPIRAHDRTGPPFRQAHDGLQMRDRSALGGGPYH